MLAHEMHEMAVEACNDAANDQLYPSQNQNTINLCYLLSVMVTQKLFPLTLPSVIGSWNGFLRLLCQQGVDK